MTFYVVTSFIAISMALFGYINDDIYAILFSGFLAVHNILLAIAWELHFTVRKILEEKK